MELQKGGKRMKSLRVFLAVVVILIGAMVIAIPPVLTQSQSFVVRFDPYYVGPGKQDWVIVENFSIDHVLNVDVMAIDPFTGEQLDEQSVREILPGEGARVVITHTMPQAHASRLFVRGIFVADANGSSVAVEGLDNDLNGELPVRVTRLLLDRAFNTKLQVSGVPVPMING
jgi:hypothetical protein